MLRFSVIFRMPRAAKATLKTKNTIRSDVMNLVVALYAIKVLCSFCYEIH